MDATALLCAMATQWRRACVTQLGTTVEEEREQRLQRQWQLELRLRHGDSEGELGKGGHGSDRLGSRN
jgi:hypothetical protein